MAINAHPNLSEKFYLGRTYAPITEDVCRKCNNVGHIRNLRIFKEKNLFQPFFEYFDYTLCDKCKIVEDKLVANRSNESYYDEYSKSEYTFNFDGFRSDDFTKNHDGKHILFAGCSVTFGVGLDFEWTWAHRLYSKINQNEKLSGYYNLGHCGGKITEIIFNIFLYCKKYSKPDVIFLLMPTIGRELSPNEDVSNYRGDEELFMNYTYKHSQARDAYLMLEEYCNSNNIKLISKTWDKHYGLFSTNNAFKDFSTYIPNNLDYFTNLLALYVEKNKEDKYAMNARDNDHAGNAFAYAESEIFYDVYRSIE